MLPGNSHRVLILKCSSHAVLCMTVSCEMLTCRCESTILFLLPQNNETWPRDEECVTPKCICFFGPIKYHSRFPVTADKNLALAQKYYQLRFQELQQLILAEESAFKCVLCHVGHIHNLTHLRTILKEIEDIKAGKWDEQLKSQLTGHTPASQENLPADTVSLHSAHVFSQLSHV